MLQNQPASTVINITSGLAFVPGATVPTYSATKAAMHSYSLSLRHQLRNTTTQVIEIIPPYVQTDLGPHHASDPRAMPLQDFIAETMQLLKDHPENVENVVEKCFALRYAIEEGRFNDVYHALNGS